MDPVPESERIGAMIGIPVPGIGVFIFNVYTPVLKQLRVIE
jgi:hypothetical protein